MLLPFRSDAVGEFYEDLAYSGAAPVRRRHIQVREFGLRGGQVGGGGREIRAGSQGRRQASPLAFQPRSLICEGWETGGGDCGLSNITGTKRHHLRSSYPVSYTHLRAHETPEHLVCR